MMVSVIQRMSGEMTQRAIKKRREKDRMVTDVNLESLRRPLTDRLNHVNRDASLCEGGGTPSMQ